jgi:ATP-dependent Clp protease protease subunit
MRTFYKIDPKLHIEKLQDLIDIPKIIRVNEFDEEALEDFEEDMDDAHATGQPVIPIVIDSFGGSVYGCLGFLAAIESAKVPVATIVTSKAMSAGAIVFCFGTEGYRYMHPNATLMIHDVGASTGGKVEEIKVDANHLDEINNSIYKRTSLHIGHDQNFISNLISKNRHADLFLNAKQAKKHKFANHLKVPNFEVEINLCMKFQ